MHKCLCNLHNSWRETPDGKRLLGRPECRYHSNIKIYIFST